MMEIYHSELKKAVNTQNIRVVSYEIPDENGENQDEKFVEFDVVGENHTWKDYIPYKKFKDNNPLVDLKAD